MTELVGLVIERKRGDTAPDEILITDAETGLPRDITAFSYVLTVNVLKDPTDSDAPLVTIAGTITDALNGAVQFQWTVPEADQAPGTYYYDIQQTDASGRIKTIAKSRYRFYQDITK